MVFCPKCGTQQTPTGRVCIKCNAPLSSTMKIDVSGSVPQAKNLNQPSNQLSNQSPNQPPNQYSNQPLNQNFGPLGQPQNILPPINQTQMPVYAPQPNQSNQPNQPNQTQSNLFNQPAPPPWSYQTSEQERQKMVYPSVDMPKPNDSYNPGQYLQPFAQNYPASNQPQIQFPLSSSNTSSNTASNRAIWSLIFSILSFVFCPIFAAMIGVTLSYQELEAIEKGLAPAGGKPVAQIGYYLGMANMVLYAIGICLIFLLTII